MKHGKLREALSGDWIRWVSEHRERAHLFSESEIRAVDVALAAERPLLLLGEPGLGKTQLAEATAAALKAPFVRWTVDARTAPGDLLFQVDYVERLAAAQVAGVTRGEHAESKADTQDESGVEALARDNFLNPGPLWWALDWEQARRFRLGEPPERHQEFESGDRVVVLIDEIDKADPDVPNALLEVLGSDRFRGPGYDVNRDPKKQAAPLVVITSNDERDLPDAFLRRCVVHVLTIPEEADAFFVERGRLQFKDLAEDVLIAAAECLIKDRSDLGSGPKPGLAEYLDLLRVLNGIPAEEDETAASRCKCQIALIEQLQQFTFQKYGAIAAQRRGRNE